MCSVVGFTYGLSQPFLAQGFNAAIDIRYKRLVVTYSNGQGLDYACFETNEETTAGAAVSLPWTTGDRVGVLLIDELWGHLSRARRSPSAHQQGFV